MTVPECRGAWHCHTFECIKVQCVVTSHYQKCMLHGENEKVTCRSLSAIKRNNSRGTGDGFDQDSLGHMDDIHYTSSHCDCLHHQSV